MAEPLRILVADTNSLTAYALSYLLDDSQFIVLPEQVGSCTQVRAYCAQYSPDILVLPWELANPYPEAIIGRLHQDFPNIRIILVDGNGDDIPWPHLVSVGIAGYVRRSDPPEIWQRCFRALAEGDVYIGRWTSSPSPVDQASDGNPPQDQLAERDIKLLQLLANGLTNEEIAAELGLSKHTVKNSLTTLYKQIDVQTRTQAIAWGIQAGVLVEYPT